MLPIFLHFRLNQSSLLEQEVSSENVGLMNLFGADNGSSSVFDRSSSASNNLMHHQTSSRDIVTSNNK